VQSLPRISPLSVSSLVLGAALGVTALSTPVSADAGTSCARGVIDLTYTGQIVRPSAGCSLVGRPVSAGWGSVKVPAPEHGVTLNITRTNGEDTLHVRTARDGSVHVTDLRRAKSASTSPQPALAGGDSSSYKSACSDAAYTKEGFKESDNHHWSYNYVGEPSNLSGNTNDVIAVKSAYGNLVSGYTNCSTGGRNPSGLSQTYDGLTTTRRGSVSATACGSGDSQNTVYWGSFGQNGALALTCSYEYYVLGVGTGEETESDTVINSSYPWSATPSTCSGQYDLQGVMMHEAGHTWGLDHVPENPDGNLTMSTNNNGPCQGSERTLGYGDRQGLISIYGSTTILA